MPARWSQVRATVCGTSGRWPVCSHRVRPSQVKRVSSTTLSPWAARACVAVRRPRLIVSLDGEVISAEAPLDYKIRKKGLRVVAP